MRFLLILVVCFSAKLRAQTQDFENLPFLSENLKIGVGMSYSKLEANTLVGNYFLLSQANPRLELSYSSPIVDSYRHKFTAYYKQELFRPENNIFIVKTKLEQGSFTLGWQPIWLSEDKVFNRYFKFALKNASVISEFPNNFSLYGDIANRYSLEAGLGFTWYALTVSKFPVGLDFQILYSQTLFDHSKVTYYNGYVYRIGVDFEFKKRSLFTGWGFRGFYDFAEIRNEFSQTVDKELGIIINKSFSF